MPSTEALWGEPEPGTPEGRRLWLNLVAEYPNRKDRTRDVGQRICQIEAEAVAAERARIRAAVEEMACECTDHSRCTPECEPASEVPTAVVLAIIDTDA